MERAQRLCRRMEVSPVRVRLELRLGLARQGNEIQLEGRRRRERRRERSARWGGKEVPLSLAPCSQGPRFLICVG